MDKIKKEIIKRVIDETDHIIKTKNTIRQTAQIFKISKSTVHKDLKEKLIQIDKNKYEIIKQIMQQHIEIRHINGGESTRKRYKKLRVQ